MLALCAPRVSSEASRVVAMQHLDALTQFLIAGQAVAKHRVRDRVVLVDVSALPEDQDSR